MNFDTHSLTAYLIPISTILGFTVAGWIFKTHIHKQLKKIAARTKWRGDDVILSAVESTSVQWFFLAGIYFALDRIPMSPELLGSVRNVIVILIILSITFSVARAGVGLLELFAESTDALPSAAMFTNLIRIFIITIGLLIVFQTLGISITPLLTALGVGGLAVSLALKDTLSDVFAGLHILLSKKVVPGDLVELDSGHRGTVDNITWRNTTLKDRKGNLVVIPNAKLSAAIMKNFDAPLKELVVRVACGVSYDSDLERVERVTLEVAKDVMQNSDGGIPEFEPNMIFMNFGDSSIDFRVSLRSKDYSGQWTVTHEFIKRLHKRFGQEGINIPFPIRTIYQKKE